MPRPIELVSPLFPSAPPDAQPHVLGQGEEKVRALRVVARAEEGDIGGERGIARRGDDVAVSGEGEVTRVVAERAPFVDEGGEPEARGLAGDGGDVADVVTGADVREPLRVAVPHRVLAILHERCDGLELEAEALREEHEIRAEASGAKAHPPLRRGTADGTRQRAVIEHEGAMAGALEGAGET